MLARQRSKIITVIEVYKFFKKGSEELYLNGVEKQNFTLNYYLGVFLTKRFGSQVVNGFKTFS